MQTPSHLLITAFAAKQAKYRSSIPILMVPLLIGSVLPDIPFTLLTIGGEIWFRWFATLPVETMSIMEYLHFDSFFNDPLWIISHKFFHSLVINGLLIGLGWWAIQRQLTWGNVLFWLAIGAAIHTLIDIPTHSSDGPLFLFPLNWPYRFASPVSYWEASNYGLYFIIGEWIINGSIIAYFALGWFHRRQQKSVSIS